MTIEDLFMHLHDGQILAAQLRSTSPGHTAWAGVYPLCLESQGTHEILRREGIAVLPNSDIRIYRIRTFEIAESLEETYFSEAEMKQKQSALAFGDDMLLNKLEELGIDVSRLALPHQVNYPL